jgi:hypothetical protein
MTHNTAMTGCQVRFPSFATTILLFVALNALYHLQIIVPLKASIIRVARIGELGTTLAEDDIFRFITIRTSTLTESSNETKYGS